MYFKNKLNPVGILRYIIYYFFVLYKIWIGWSGKFVFFYLAMLTLIDFKYWNLRMNHFDCLQFLLAILFTSGAGCSFFWWFSWSFFSCVNGFMSKEFSWHLLSVEIIRPDTILEMVWTNTSIIRCSPVLSAYSDNPRSLQGWIWWQFVQGNSFSKSSNFPSKIRTIFHATVIFSHD